MIIAAAQTIPKNSVDENFEDHYRLIELAANKGVELIIFPELSLTGYVREQAKHNSFTPNDSRLNNLIELAKSRNIIIVAGAPIKLEEKLYIGSFIIHPNNNIDIYTKQHLHTGEENFFHSSFQFNPQIKLENEIFSLAICADIAHIDHPRNASQANCTIYLASIFYTPTGILEGHNSLKEYAETFSLNILVSNYGGKSGQWESAGKSAFWTNKGELTNSFEGTGEGLLISKKTNSSWTSMIIKTN